MPAGKKARSEPAQAGEDDHAQSCKDLRPGKNVPKARRSGRQVSQIMADCFIHGTLSIAHMPTNGYSKSLAWFPIAPARATAVNAERSPLMAGAHDDRCAAVVVGCGPAGLTAAIALAEGGLSTLLVGKRPAKSDNRTIALLASSVTALDTLGVWQSCAARRRLSRSCASSMIQAGCGARRKSNLTRARSDWRRSVTTSKIAI